ncbi:MAG: TusE/DsrC/DsvC family sulfur relay protein [Anaerolineales bacterium]|nr:TusE/DsrC/DsvC family sulfur relay protein [Anaerolineales bacterium]
MTTKEFAGATMEVNEEGFLVDPQMWNKDIAVAIAKEEGIDELTEDHWKVIEFCRQSATDNGAAPTLRQITSGTGITTKELFKLYPKGPAKKVAKISGLGKPEGCV